MSKVQEFSVVLAFVKTVHITSSKRENLTGQM